MSAGINEDAVMKTGLNVEKTAKAIRNPTLKLSRLEDTRHYGKTKMATPGANRSERRRSQSQVTAPTSVCGSVCQHSLVFPIFFNLDLSLIYC